MRNGNFIHCSEINLEGYQFQIKLLMQSCDPCRNTQLQNVIKEIDFYKEELRLMAQQAQGIFQGLDRINDLHGKLELLSMEKNSQDNQFNVKHQNALKLMGSLHTQIQKLRDEIVKLNKTNDHQILLSLRQRIAELECQIQNLKKDIQSLISYQQTLVVSRQQNQHKIKELTDQLSHLQTQIKNLRKDNDAVFQRRTQAQIYLDEVLAENQFVKKQTKQLQEENAALRKKLGGNKTKIQDLQNMIDVSKMSIKNLQAVHAQLRTVKDRQIDQLQSLAKQVQNQHNRNGALQNKIVQGQVILRRLEHAIASVPEGSDEIQTLKKQIERLQNHLGSCHTHIENLFNQNNQLANHLQSMSKEDQDVQKMLNNLSLVERTKNNVSGQYINARRALSSQDCLRMNRPNC